jgi:hypothetical protein
MDYDATLTITGPAGTDGLGRTTGSTTAVYDGPADVQEGAVMRRTEDGQAFQLGDAKAFLPLGESLDGISVGDAATITWADGSTQSATVAETRRLDGSLVLSYT